MKLGSAHEGKLLQTLEGRTFWVHTATFSPDGNYLISADQDGIAKIWNAHTGAWLFDLDAHGIALTSARFSPDGLFSITASTDTTARVWRVFEQLQ